MESLLTDKRTKITEATKALEILFTHTDPHALLQRNGDILGAFYEAMHSLAFGETVEHSPLWKLYGDVVNNLSRDTGLGYNTGVRFGLLGLAQQHDQQHFSPLEVDPAKLALMGARTHNGGRLDVEVLMHAEHYDDMDITNIAQVLTPTERALNIARIKSRIDGINQASAGPYQDSQLATRDALVHWLEILDK